MKPAGHSVIPAGRRQPRAFSMVEVVLSLAIVSGMLVMALRAVAASRISQIDNQARATAIMLAEDLLSEILQMDYEDPDQPDDIVFNLEPGEPRPNRRSFYDDVDDYINWTGSPPRYRDGTIIEGTDDFVRSAKVRWVEADDVSQLSGSSTGVKRVAVTVTFRGRELARYIAYRTESWGDPVEVSAEQ